MGIDGWKRKGERGNKKRKKIWSEKEILRNRDENYGEWIWERGKKVKKGNFEEWNEEYGEKGCGRSDWRSREWGNEIERCGEGSI